MRLNCRRYTNLSQLPMRKGTRSGRPASIHSSLRTPSRVIRMVRRHGVSPRLQDERERNARAGGYAGQAAGTKQTGWMCFPTAATIPPDACSTRLRRIGIALPAFPLIFKTVKTPRRSSASLQ
jgi:hypothetical protein